MKELKRKLLFVLASDVDFFDTVEAFSYWPYPTVYWRMNKFAAVSVRVAMNDLVKTGLVARIIRGREPQFRLTVTGKDQLWDFFAANRRLGRWDRTWRMVILSRGRLSQAELRRLRLVMKRFGLVALETGVFVSPGGRVDELKRGLIEQNLLRAVTMVETKRFVIGDDRAFATHIWGLDELVKRYQALITRSDRLLERVKRAKVLTNQQKSNYVNVLNEWFKILWDDPGLPNKLLPADWPHLEARQVMVKLGKMVRRTEEEQVAYSK